MDKFISQNDSSLKKKKRRWKPKGRQVENNFYEEVSRLFIGINFKRDCYPHSVSFVENT